MEALFKFVANTVMRARATSRPVTQLASRALAFTATCLYVGSATAQTVPVNLMVMGTVGSITNRSGTAALPPAAVGSAIQVKVSYDPATPPASTTSTFYGAGIISQYTLPASAASYTVSAGALSQTSTVPIVAQTYFNVPGGGCAGFLFYGLMGVLSFVGSDATDGLSLSLSVFVTPPFPPLPPLLRTPSLPASNADFTYLAPPPNPPLGSGCPGPHAAYPIEITTADWLIKGTLEPATIQLSPQQPPAPNVALNATSLDFGIVNVGASKTLKVVASNTGTTTAQGAVSAAAPYSVVSSPALQILPGQSTEILIGFSPTTAGRADQAISIDFSSAAFSVQAAGFGLAPANRAPVVTKVPPVLAKSTPAIVEGRNFDFSQGTTTVTVGGVEAPVLSWYSTLIKLMVPAVPAGSQELRVTSPRGVSSVQVNILPPAPSIAKLGDASLSPNSTLAVWGQNFGTQQPDSSITINAQAMQVVQWTDKFITAKVPVMAPGPYPLRVTTASGSALSTVRVRNVSAQVNYNPCVIAIDFSAYIGKFFSPVCPPLIVSATKGTAPGTVDLKIENVALRWYQMTTTASGAALLSPVPVIVGPKADYTVTIALAQNQSVKFDVDATTDLTMALMSLDFMTQGLQALGLPVPGVPRDASDFVALVGELLSNSAPFQGLVVKIGAGAAKGDFLTVFDLTKDLLDYLATDPKAQKVLEGLGITAGTHQAANAFSVIARIVKAGDGFGQLVETLTTAPVFGSAIVVGR